MKPLSNQQNWVLVAFIGIIAIGVSGETFSFHSKLFGQSRELATERATVLPAATCLVVTPDEKAFAVGSQAGLAVRSIDGDSLWSIPTKLEHVNSCAFSPDGSVLAVAGGAPAVNGVVELWSWPQRKLLRQLKGHEDIVSDVVWVRGGKCIVTASMDRTLRVWDWKTAETLETLEGHSGPVLAMSVSPDDRWLCSAGVDQTIRVWEVRDWKLKRTLNNHLGTIHSLAFQPSIEGKAMTLASASEDGTVRIWYPEIGRLLRIVRHKVPVLCATWNHSGTRLYTGAADGAVRVLAGEYHRIAETRKLTDGWVVSLAATKADRVFAGTTEGKVELFARR